MQFTDVQLESFSPCWLSLYHFLYGHTSRNSDGKKVVGDQPVCVWMCVCSKLPGDLPAKVCVVTYLETLIIIFSEEKKKITASAPLLPAGIHLQLNSHQTLQLPLSHSLSLVCACAQTHTHRFHTDTKLD